MAQLRFYFGTMGSGKSTMALQVHHNLSVRNQRGLLCTRLSREDGSVSSRLGVAQQALEVEPDVDLWQVARSVRIRHGRLDYIVCDEANFYEVAHVEQLALTVDELDVDVYAFGLLTDFRGQLFPGAARFLELADERIELRVESRCWCGAPATHNARLINGRQVYDGDTVVVGDLDDGQAAIAYDVLCRRHWREGREAARQPQLIELRSDLVNEPKPIDIDDLPETETP